MTFGSNLHLIFAFKFQLILLILSKNIEVLVMPLGRKKCPLSIIIWFIFICDTAL